MSEAYAFAAIHPSVVVGGRDDHVGFEYLFPYFFFYTMTVVDIYTVGVGTGIKDLSWRYREMVTDKWISGNWG